MEPVLPSGGPTSPASSSLCGMEEIIGLCGRFRVRIHVPPLIERLNSSSEGFLEAKMGDETEVLALGSQSTRTTPALLMKMAWWLPLRSRRPKRTSGTCP